MPTDEPRPGGWIPGGLEGPGESEPPPEVTDRWGPLREFLRERLPPALRGGRLDPGVRGALALAGVALAAAVAAVVLAWSSSAQPAAKRAEVIPAVAVPKLSESAAPLVAPSTVAPDVVVDVAGKVRRPGLVKLASGSRVADAIVAAGGALPGASTVGMSLARRLIDGEQLVVGEPSPAASDPAAVSPQPSGPVDLNSATVSDLDALPGIGPVLAQRVVDWRTAHGAFTAVDQLRQISGLGGKKFDALAPLVRV
jgi:competence protein ComEA